jgi:putative endonuclease
MASKKQKQPFGEYGEQLACDYLASQGYEIITTNWRCPLGEIDIVARKDSMTIFVEVRSRHAETTEDAFASINKHKQIKMVAAAQEYIDSNELDQAAWRIDAIGIAVQRSGQTLIEHIEDAIGW